LVRNLGRILVLFFVVVYLTGLMKLTIADLNYVTFKSKIQDIPC
jgi:hypothetical protein